MKMAAMNLGNTPRPTAWSPALASFPPPALILATSLSNFPSSYDSDFLVNGVGRMIGSKWKPPWVPKGCIYAFGESWGMLHLALHEIYLGREANLVSINPASSRFSRFVALPCRQHISHVRTLSNANSVSSLCAMKLSSTLIFIAFLGNKDKVPKTASEDNLSDFRLVCTVGTLGVIFPTSLSRIGPSTCPN
jgi:hypothetical protein